MNERTSDTIQWLLEGDVSIRFQTRRDLPGEFQPDLQRRIQNEGWGRAFLEKRQANGHWGQRFYQPKWTSTHYTLLDLKNLSIAPDIPVVRETIRLVLQKEKGPDGGILPIGTTKRSDVCVNGMFLNYASYFGADEAALHAIVDFLPSQYMPDGGYNCQSNRRKCVHSSLWAVDDVAVKTQRRDGLTGAGANALKPAHPGCLHLFEKPTSQTGKAG